jgi:polynucleotide 5'-kinase involved in rRNA processing
VLVLGEGIENEKRRGPERIQSGARRPLCIVIAGPNGAGKTTFAREFLLNDTRVIHFVNADVIASGLSPLRPA